MMYVKKISLGFNEVIQIKEKKMARETKCQILIVNKKNWLVKTGDHVKKNLNMREQKNRDETPKTYIDSKKIYVFRFFI